MKSNKTGLMLFSIALGTFMSAMDGSIVNISYPQIMNYFHIPQSSVEWAITAYLLVISSVLLFFGRLSDMYGQKRLFLTGFTVFTVGSALCSLSSSIGMLIALRVFQAMGAGMMFSTNSAIITHNVPAEKRGRAFSVIAIAVAVALSTGPVLGGWLTENFRWQSIFYINVPIGAIGIILAAKFIPVDKKAPAAALDIPGSLMIFAALFLILLPLDQMNAGLGALPAAAMLACGAALAVVFVLYEKKAKAPIVNLKLFRSRVFSAGLAASVLNFTAQNTMLFLLPLFLQTTHGNSPAEAGFFIMPMPLTMLIIAPAAGYISDRFDTRYISSAGMAVMAAGLFMLSYLNVNTSEWFIRAAMVVTGLGCGMFQTPNNSAVMSHVPAANRGIASGMLATARNIGMVIGVGISGAVFTLTRSIAEGDLAQKGFSGAALSQASFVSGLHVTFIVAGFVALAATAASLTKGKILTPAMLEKPKE
jgi:EmrB/QacA subfamily drug resistance transporter